MNDGLYDIHASWSVVVVAFFPLKKFFLVEPTHVLSEVENQTWWGVSVHSLTNNEMA